MANVIRIQRSVSTNTPTALEQGELAYSETGSPNGEGELFVGTAGPAVTKIATTILTGTNGAAAQPNTSAQDNQTLTTGVGIDGADAGDDTDFTISLALDELSVGTMLGADWIAFDNAGVSEKALISAINLSLFNDDLGHVENVTHTGQVTGSGALILNTNALCITAQPAHGVIIAADTILSNDGGVLSEASFTQMTTFFDAALAFGQVDSIVAGVGIVGSGTTTVTLDLDFSELTDMTASISGTTEFILQNGTVESRKIASEIGLQFFDNATAEFVSENDSLVVADWQWVLDEDNLGTDSAVHLATQQSIKAYVDGVVASGVTYLGSFDPTALAGTGAPDLDTITSSTGDMYTVTVAGTYNWTTGSAILEVGDVLIAESDGVLNNVANWTIVQNNLSAATITTSGYVSVGAQTFGGTKTFEDISGNDSGAVLDSFVIDGGTF